LLQAHLDRDQIRITGIGADRPSRIIWEADKLVTLDFPLRVKVKISEPGADREAHLQLSTIALHSLYAIDDIAKSLSQYSMFREATNFRVIIVKAVYGGGSTRKVIAFTVPSEEHALLSLDRLEWSFPSQMNTASLWNTCFPRCKGSGGAFPTPSYRGNPNWNIGSTAPRSRETLEAGPSRPSLISRETGLHLAALDAATPFTDMSRKIPNK
jgi:hypothetical protein